MDGGSPPEGINVYKMYQQHVQDLNQQQAGSVAPSMFDSRTSVGGAGAHPSAGPESLHGVVKRCLRIFSGRLSCTPTASLPNTEDMGLLMFLNLKQAHLKHATRGVDLYQFPALKPLLSIIEFINYIVGGLIVEAEKVDEMYIAIRKEMVKRQARIDYQKQDLKVRTRGVGSQVHQILAAHFPSKPLRTAPRSQVANTNMSVPHLDGLGDEEVLQIRQQHQSMEDDKWVLHQLRMHLRTANAARSLLHGKTPGGVNEDVANGIVQELNITQTFRKAMHKIKDCLNEVEDKSSLPALQTLSQFLDYLHYGVAVSLDELETCEVMLRKRTVGDSADRKIQMLDARVKENKLMSCSALRFNSTVNSPKKNQSLSLSQSALGQSTVNTHASEVASGVFGGAPTATPPAGSVAAHFGYGTGDGRRVFDSRPDPRTLATADVATHATSQQRSYASTEKMGDARMSMGDDFLDAYCCD